jgi:hypothetical protein
LVRLVTHRDVGRNQCIDAAEVLTQEIEVAAKNSVQ